METRKNCLLEEQDCVPEINFLITRTSTFTTPLLTCRRRNRRSLIFWEKSVGEASKGMLESSRSDFASSHAFTVCFRALTAANCPHRIATEVFIGFHQKN